VTSRDLFLNYSSLSEALSTNVMVLPFFSFSELVLHYSYKLGGKGGGEEREDEPQQNKPHTDEKLSTKTFY